MTLVGEHFYKGSDDYFDMGVGFVQRSLLQNLQKWTVQQDGSSEIVPVGKMGISHAVITQNDHCTARARSAGAAGQSVPFP